MRDIRSGLAAFLLAACLAGAAWAQDPQGSDCNLCRDVAGGNDTVVPAQGTPDPQTVYNSNLLEIAKCLQTTLLGDPATAPPDSPWLAKVEADIGAGRWAPLPCGSDDGEDAKAKCRTSSDRIAALYLVVFGKPGADSAGSPSSEKARLTCQAVFGDLDAAATSVAGAAR